ncbi:hypothetical protein GDO81_021518 [Engystomops pustulosus]|uniref:Uncharacterized protein n=1 Tax=Engystomops pustulosus TaxID=76066 RepID=A0AAV6YV48_ENGPU|nr:hypothetical protein GDO81_021518 [Engystomops pustulosus]
MGTADSHHFHVTSAGRGRGIPLQASFHKTMAQTITLYPKISYSNEQIHGPHLEKKNMLSIKIIRYI